jgi:hypothetical protein
MVVAASGKMFSALLGLDGRGCYGLRVVVSRRFSPGRLRGTFFSWNAMENMIFILFLTREKQIR